MDIRYIEGVAALSIPNLNQAVKRGEVVTVPDKIGTQLIAQGWEQVNPSKTTDKSQKETK